MYRDVAEVELALQQLLQVGDARRAEEHDPVRLGHVQHLALQPDAAADAARRRRAVGRRRGVLLGAAGPTPAVRLVGGETRPAAGGQQAGAVAVRRPWRQLDAAAHAHHEHAVAVRDDRIERNGVERRPHHREDVAERVLVVGQLAHDALQRDARLHDAELAVEDDVEWEGAAERRRADARLVA